MESERINSIKNWPKLKSIRKIQVFIKFVNFYRWFIWNFSASVRLFTSMLKTGLGSQLFKPVKKST